MNAETIKDFLISLGFNVDEAGAKKFDSVVAGTTLKAIEMGVKIEAAALSVVAFTAKIASGLDNLYWASQRTGATVEGIKRIGYAVGQMGGSVDAARGSLENLARFVRNSPGAEGFLNRLGVQTRDAKGNMNDMASIFTGVGQRLSSMPYYRANQYAQMLGLDENTLMAMRRGIGEYTGQYNAMKKAIGFNPDRAAESANKFMTSLTALGEVAGMARDKIGSNLANGLAGSIDNLRRQIMDNFPKIEGVITAIVKGILWAGEIIGRFVYRIMQAASDIREWWKGLDGDTQKLIGTFGGLLVMWRLMNAAMLASPITWVLALAGAIMLLYDDYKTWQEGGKSLIDWKAWEPAIEKAMQAIIWIRDKLIGLKDSVGGWQNAFELLATFVVGSWAVKMLSGISKVGRGFGPILAAMAAISAWDKIGQAQEEARREGKDVGQYLVDRANQRQGSTDGFFGQANQMLNKAYTWWDGMTSTGGATNAYDAYGTVKRPQPTKAGAHLLGWMAPMMGQLEALYNLPAGLLRSVALTESGGNQFARGPQTKYGQAKGMFQFVDGTARDMGLRGNDVFDPIKSAEAAARYLSMLLQKNGGDLGKTLASYNWGIGNVQRHGMALMPQETRQYIPKVMSNMPGGSTTLHQETNIHVHGINNPQEAANLVVERQSAVNTRAAQDLGRGS